MISYRKLEKQELQRIGEIDRSEEISGFYQYQSGQLKFVEQQESVTGFEEGELEAIMDRQQKILETAGLVFGAFHHNKLIAVASVENKKRGLLKNYSKMDILYVDGLYQAKGIGRELVNLCLDAAKSFGADKLYISATPTKNTVDFYLRLGAIPVLELDKQLFAEEPADIHLELSVNR